jgi:hypothetical protein
VTPRKRVSQDGDAVLAPGDRVKLTSKMQLNPEPLKVVDISNRRFWEEMAAEVKLDVAQRFRKRWTKAETLRVISASPEETYDDVAKEINRTPGGVRYRRMAMVHLLREEHGAPERVQAYEADPKAAHKFHDYWEVHNTMKELGLYDLPAWQQIDLAKELRQPSKSWRGDGTSAALANGDLLTEVRHKVMQLIEEAKANAGQQPTEGNKAPAPAKKTGATRRRTGG